MIRALLYLEACAWSNGLRQRLRRLRQPRYLAGAIAGAAYMYFFFFRHLLRGAPPPAALTAAPWAQGVDWSAALVSATAFGLFLFAALAWIFGPGRAALTFTEAEIAFLFPAPVARRTLLHYKILKAQFAILLSAVVLSIFSRGWGGAETHGFFRLTGWWILFSLFNLHGLAAAFTRERLLDLGLNPLRRRLLAVLLLLALGAATWVWTGANLPMTLADVRSGPDVVRYLHGILSAAPLTWVLTPFRAAVAPYFAGGTAEFLLALGPALLLLAAHYWWVIRSAVAFEEASVALAEKRASQRAHMRANGGEVRVGKARPRSEPFRLHARGHPLLALLWKRLIAAGPLYYPRTWLAFAALPVAAVLWLRTDPAYAPILKVVAAVCAFGLVYALPFGPALTRTGLGHLFQRLDVVKTYPLPGWQIILGELLSPIVLFTVVEWTLLVIAVLAASAIPALPGPLGGVLVPLGVGLALLVPPLAGLVFSIPFASLLYFPAWFHVTPGQNPGGIEVLGQRLIFFAGYVVVMFAALLPAAAFAALPFFATRLLGAAPAVQVLSAAGAAALALAFELAGVLAWLGSRIEAFDLSDELPR